MNLPIDQFAEPRPRFLPGQSLGRVGPSRASAVARLPRRLLARYLLVLLAVWTGLEGAPGVAIADQGAQEQKVQLGNDFPDGLEIHGKVVDIETGRPIGNFIVQEGKPAPDHWGQIDWNAGESGTSFNPSGSLNTTVIDKGHWARVVAPGYVPRTILDEPYDGRPRKVEVTVRLRRGWRISGRVLDASRKPVAGASLFLVGGRMSAPNITGGKAWRWPVMMMRSEDKTVTKAMTDGDGRFVFNGVGGYETAIAVSAPAIDLWIHRPVPALGNPCEIVLPAPGKLVLRYDLEGGEPEATLSVSGGEDWTVASNQREVKVLNGGKLVPENLAPGTYRVAREKTLRVGNARRSPHLESRSAVVASGKTCELAVGCERGAVVEGEIIGLDKLKLPGAMIYVVRPEPESLELMRLNNQVNEAVEALTCDATGRFKTPRLPPGNYAIVVEGYGPRPAEFRFSPGWPAAHRATATLKVPEHGPAPRIRIELPAEPGDGKPADDAAGAR